MGQHFQSMLVQMNQAHHLFAEIGERKQYFLAEAGRIQLKCLKQQDLLGRELEILEPLLIEQRRE